MDLENAYDKIYRYVYFRIQNQTVAEDITQETFLHFISQKGNIHDYEMKYLYTIARNLCGIVQLVERLTLTQEVVGSLRRARSRKRGIPRMPATLLPQLRIHSSIGRAPGC